MFQPFYRALGTNVDGSGLGLPISRRIIEHFGGRIWVESRFGAGATFIFTVPSALAPATTLEAAK